MEFDEFRKFAHELVDWMADYMENVRKYPVKSQVEPGDILNQLPESAPLKGESFDKIFEDFQNIIVPGMTHWQHPKFFAYFPGNSSPPSVLAEMLMSTLGAQCMMWQTSPSAAELEERVLDWLKQMLGLPSEWSGVIQDTASTATLCAILTAREKVSNFEINKRGFESKKFAIYCSTETHSSIEKDVKIAGFGSDNIRKIDVDENYAMIPEELKKAVKLDLMSGLTPLCIVATIGTTGSTAVDPIKEIADICSHYSIWFHVDAAYAGTALLLPEMRWMSNGIESADSFVFNPHKWMFTNFDCSAYYVKDEKALIQTFEILPEYLKITDKQAVKDYRNWGIQLGRRFRALKLWFVIRTYGVDGLKEMISNHIKIAQNLAEKIDKSNDFELMAPVPLNLICFRYHPKEIEDNSKLNELNKIILEKLNKTGQLFLSHTELKGNYVIRLHTGQTFVTKEDVDQAWTIINQTISVLN
jgi:aromatic-L-amino-acid decarboxylase